MIHFKTGTYPMQIKRVSCDAEIGSHKRGWHVCNAKAVVRGECRVCDHLFLDYCKAHAKRAITLRNVTPI